jgi:hypothetical protein
VVVAAFKLMVAERPPELAVQAAVALVEFPVRLEVLVLRMDPAAAAVVVMTPHQGLAALAMPDL